MSINVNTQAQAAALNEIDRWSQYLNNALADVAKDIAEAQEAIANGQGTIFTPNTAKVEEYAAKRNALIELSPALDLDGEWLETALKGNRAFYTVAE